MAEQGKNKIDLLDALLQDFGVASPKASGWQEAGLSSLRDPQPCH